MTVKQLLEELQKERYDKKGMQVLVEDGFGGGTYSVRELKSDRNALILSISTIRQAEPDVPDLDEPGDD